MLSVQEYWTPRVLYFKVPNASILTLHSDRSTHTVRAQLIGDGHCVLPGVCVCRRGNAQNGRTLGGGDADMIIWLT